VGTHASGIVIGFAVRWQRVKRRTAAGAERRFEGPAIDYAMFTPPCSPFARGGKKTLPSPTVAKQERDEYGDPLSMTFHEASLVLPGLSKPISPRAPRMRLRPR
jgi:hypothetical protein